MGGGGCCSVNLDLKRVGEFSGICLPQPLKLEMEPSSQHNQVLKIEKSRGVSMRSR